MRAALGQAPCGALPGGGTLRMAELLSTSLDVAAARQRFSALQQGFAFFDAPGGSQVPDEVGDAISRALREASANLGAGYATSRRAGEIDRKSTRLNSSHLVISYAVFCL